jgi:cytochrome P450
MQEDVKARYGDLWTLRLLHGVTWVMVSRPDLVEEVFKADPHVLHGGESNVIAKNLLGPKSVLILDGDEHSAQRKLLRPFFYGERLDRYPEIMATIAEQELASWPINEPFSLLPRFEQLTVRIIINVIFGMDEGPEQEELRRRIRNLLKFGDNNLRMIAFRLMALQGKAPKAFVEVRDPLDNKIYEVIESARRDPRLDERDDVLATLIRARHEDGSPMTNDELRDELMTLLIQGHQSSATTLSWAMERLMRHPDAMERLREEAQAGQDEYLDAVFKETLRMRPPLPMAGRLVKEPFRLDQYDLDPGDRVAVLIYQVHRRPEFYPDPERFRPERFMEEPGASAMWIPFGGGPRHCIGRSFATTVVKIVLRTLATQARFKPVEPADEKVKHRRVLYSPGRGAMAILTERNQPTAQSVAA